MKAKLTSVFVARHRRWICFSIWMETSTSSNICFTRVHVVKTRSFEKKTGEKEKKTTLLRIRIFTQIACQQKLNSSHCQRSTWTFFFSIRFGNIQTGQEKQQPSRWTFILTTLLTFLCAAILSNSLSFGNVNEFTRSRCYLKNICTKQWQVLRRSRKIRRRRKKNLINYKLFGRLKFQKNHIFGPQSQTDPK